MNMNMYIKPAEPPLSTCRLTCKISTTCEFGFLMKFRHARHVQQAPLSYESQLRPLAICETLLSYAGCKEH